MSPQLSSGRWQRKPQGPGLVVLPQGGFTHLSQVSSQWGHSCGRHEVTKAGKHCPGQLCCTVKLEDGPLPRVPVALSSRVGQPLPPLYRPVQDNSIHPTAAYQPRTRVWDLQPDAQLPFGHKLLDVLTVPQNHYALGPGERRWICPQSIHPDLTLRFRSLINCINCNSWNDTYLPQ